MTALWIAVIIAAVGSYALKLAGLALPESILNQPTVQRIARYLPIAMVSALRELSTIFAVLIGWLVMREKLTTRRIVACTLVTLGAVLIRI